MAKSVTTIMLAKDRVAEMREVKARAERWAGRPLSWGDFVALLMTVYEARGEVGGVDRGIPVAEMHQDVPLSEEELAAAGWEEIPVPPSLREAQATAGQLPPQAPGIPITLSEEDQERIAELVAKKVIERLTEVLGPNTNPSNQTNS